MLSKTNLTHFTERKQQFKIKDERVTVIHRPMLFMGCKAMSYICPLVL